MGLRMHQGSRRCEIRKEAIPLKEKVRENNRAMEMAGKKSIVANIAFALQRRGLAQLSGLEISETKLFIGDSHCEVKEEYWVHGWVRKLWKKYADEGYTRKFYAIMEKLQALPEDERDSELGLILLGMCDD